MPWAGISQDCPEKPQAALYSSHFESAGVSPFFDTSDSVYHRSRPITSIPLRRPISFPHVTTDICHFASPEKSPGSARSDENRKILIGKEPPLLSFFRGSCKEVSKNPQLNLSSGNFCEFNGHLTPGKSRFLFTPFKINHAILVLR